MTSGHRYWTIFYPNRNNVTKDDDWYREALKLAANVTDGIPQLIVFDVSKKLLLPHIVRPPGKLYLVTGLNFELFGSQNFKTQHNRFWPTQRMLTKQNRPKILSCRCYFFPFLYTSFPRTSSSAFSTFLYTLKILRSKTRIVLCWYTSIGEC